MIRRLRQWRNRIRAQRQAEREAMLVWYCGWPLTPEEVERYGKASR